MQHSTEPSFDDTESVLELLLLVFEPESATTESSASPILGRFGASVALGGSCGSSIVIVVVFVVFAEPDMASGPAEVRLWAVTGATMSISTSLINLSSFFFSL